ncbi:hypothetical protein [Hymenobacter convexus]|uniref:hypothetical protein n=1 Tax=Hymenobacter sp. CA1UV-4 TaxID=3063782 RepID=UPI002712B763|nr:hypothetical protein [Hymenobacter sp. CA1UV-4]MDO7853171.1 hypothetical protein [Hymenobacter sp. CA1UV-4]
MSLAHLDQVIALEHGQARQLFWEIGNVLRRVALGSARQPPRRVEAALFLALPVLQRVARRLYRVAQREADALGPPRRRPWRFRLKPEEVVAIVLHVLPGATGALPELGKVQQQSLNLTQWVRFSPD